MMEVIVDITSNPPHHPIDRVSIIVPVVLVLVQLLFNNNNNNKSSSSSSSNEDSIEVHHHVVDHQHYEVRYVNEVHHQAKSKDSPEANQVAAVAEAPAVVESIPHHHLQHCVQDNHLSIHPQLLTVNGKVELRHLPNIVNSIIHNHNNENVNATATTTMMIIRVNLLQVVVDAAIVVIINKMRDSEAAVVIINNNNIITLTRTVGII